MNLDGVPEGSTFEKPRTVTVPGGTTPGTQLKDESNEHSKNSVSLSKKGLKPAANRIGDQLILTTEVNTVGHNSKEPSLKIAIGGDLSDHVEADSPLMPSHKFGSKLDQVNKNYLEEEDAIATLRKDAVNDTFE